MPLKRGPGQPPRRIFIFVKQNPGTLFRGSLRLLEAYLLPKLSTPRSSSSSRISRASVKAERERSEPERQ